ncbi:unnamed protein product [Microthlaspi erraticum]|uniref:Uncharacterized protein n=1 Tax=Microthlaspi erraticum TaxID=1685480 RepID=A0A6D2KU73_9BRAS|nr:unnamed protein product [Microthlaspi erraticum]
MDQQGESRQNGAMSEQQLDRSHTTGGVRSSSYTTSSSSIELVHEQQPDRAHHDEQQLDRAVHEQQLDRSYQEVRSSSYDRSRSIPCHLDLSRSISRSDDITAVRSTWCKPTRSNHSEPD